MVDDPYKVLELPRSAGQDEVKKAYRRKAKEYHPDMHPDDPEAGRKMNEINEAYDQIMNPEKYAKRREQQAEQQRAAQQARQQYENSGFGGGNGGFGFDFEDFFGAFTGAGSGYGGIPQPRPRADDPASIAMAVRSINAGQYRQALEYLNSVPSSGRNARWLYLSAIANYGIGNRVAAWEQIQKAAAMEPMNQEYAAAKRAIGRDAQSYETRGRDLHMDLRTPTSICAGLCLTQMCFSTFCRFRFFM